MISLLLFISLSFAQENIEAYDAIDVTGVELDQDAVITEACEKEMVERNDKDVIPECFQDAEN